MRDRKNYTETVNEENIEVLASSAQ